MQPGNSHLGRNLSLPAYGPCLSQEAAEQNVVSRCLSGWPVTKRRSKGQQPPPLCLLAVLTVGLRRTSRHHLRLLSVQAGPGAPVPASGSGELLFTAGRPRITRPVKSAGAQVLEGQALGAFRWGSCEHFRVFQMYFYNRVCDMYLHICMLPSQEVGNWK